MESLARDLYYFAYAIWKAGLMTGLLPAVLLACGYEIFFGRHLARVIPFPRKPQGPRRRAEKEWRKVA